MRRASTPKRLALLLALLLVACALWPAQTDARVGGGQSYQSSGSSGSSSSGSSGSSSSGSSGSSSSGSSGLSSSGWSSGDASSSSSGQGSPIPLPILLLAGAGWLVYVVGKKLAEERGRRIAESPHPAWSSARTGDDEPGQRGPPAFHAAAIRAYDANFSAPAFLDFATLLFQRVHRERAGGNLDALAPWVGPKLRGHLRFESGGVRAVSDVVAASVAVRSGAREGQSLVLRVYYEASLVETRAEGDVALSIEEDWTFRKNVGVLSPSPDTLVALACPSCGCPGETRPDGTCTGCGTPIGGGRALWELSAVKLLSSARITAPELSSGGAEEGTRLRTVRSPTLGLDQRALEGRDPRFDMNAFARQAEAIFLKLQAAWDAGDWACTRPYQTDCQYQSNLYWMERYRRFGLRNRLADVALEQMTLAKIERDPWYEAITVRIAARCRDWTENRAGVEVAGSRVQERRFSEYWTFLRTVEQPAEYRGDGLETCPCCGAPLKAVAETGLCSHCSARLSGGKFGWVLSRIEQDEVYRG